MEVNKSIFKAYDIRGVYPETLNEELSYKIGQAYAKFLKNETLKDKLSIVVASDMRLSGPSLKNSLIKGLIDSGVNVVDIGLSSTPSFYFAVAYYSFDGGLQVSASHNPAEHNGYKMVRENAIPISGDSGIYEIRDIVIEDKFELSKIKGKISSLDNVLEDEIKAQSNEINISEIKPFKIVVDTANSMGIYDIEIMFKNLPCTLIKLNEKLDGTFPNHEPDPLKSENLEQLSKAVIHNNADLGIASDGDADRYFFVDNKGVPLKPEILRGIMAMIELKEHPGSKIAYDIRPGRITKDLILEAGGIPVVTKVGHSLIKEQMLKSNIIFGGESSGHFFYKFDFGTFEAPMTLVLKFLVYLSKQNKSLSEIIKKYDIYAHSGEINSKVEDKEYKINELAEKFKDAINISYLDGITIEYENYWFNVRPSNTESLLRLNLEANSNELMEQKRDEVLNIIRK